MRDFYKNKQMFSNEKALQLAKLAYLENESISNLKKTPYYWSGFVSIGNVDEVSNLYPFWIGILILFMILGIYIFIKRKG